MLFRDVYKFLKLNLIALWLDMLSGLFISLFLALVNPILCKDYFQEATQKGLDYGKII